MKDLAELEKKLKALRPSAPSAELKLRCLRPPQPSYAQGPADFLHLFFFKYAWGMAVAAVLLCLSLWNIHENMRLRAIMTSNFQSREVAAVSPPHYSRALSLPGLSQGLCSCSLLTARPSGHLNPERKSIRVYWRVLLE